MKLPRPTATGAFAIAIVLAMGLSLRNGFVYDDVPAIAANSRVTDPAQWHTILTAPYWLGTLWRPLTVFLFALQWFVGHGAPWLFHLVSLLAYFAIGLTLFRLLTGAVLSSRIGPFGAAAATVLFLVHPVHVEVVANSVGQAELWVALALAGATMVYLRARQTGTERQSFPLLVAIVALGIMAKEQGFVAPLLLAGAEWLLLDDRHERLRSRVGLLAPVTGVAILLFVVRGVLLNSSVGESPAVALQRLTFSGRLMTFLAVVPEWARLIVWPIHLQADYGPPGIPVGGPIHLRHGIGIVLVIGYIALFVRWRRRAPVAAFGLFWMAIALAPVSNLLTPTGIVMAERVLFLPTVGLAITAASLIRQPQWVHARERLLASIVIAWALVMTVRSAVRVPTWRTQEGFYSQIIVDAPLAYRGWMVAAKYADDAHDTPRAIAELQQAMALWPHDYEVAERLGQIYRQNGNCDAAIPVFAEGLQEDSSATSLRAKLVECQITVRDWDAAARTADDGVALGYDEFRPMQARVKKLRESHE